MKFLLVEDSAGMAAVILDGIRKEGYRIDHAKTGEEGLAKAREEEYDLLICDILLPDLNGLDLVKKLRSEQWQVPVLFLSAKDTVDDRVTGLAAGGDDYLVKPFDFAELIARSQALLRRSRPQFEQEELIVGDMRLDLRRHKVYRGEKEIRLQPLELQLLEYMMRNTSRVLSKKRIREEVWDFDFDPGSNVVEVRVHHLRDKVDRGFDRKLIHTVRGVGYVLEER